MISNIPAGKLTARVTLLRPASTITTGSHVKTYTDDVTVWANLKQVSLREIMRSQVEMQTETYTVLMRYRPGITQEWCLRLPNQKRYRIISINTDPKSGAMIIGAELDNSISQTVTS